MTKKNPSPDADLAPGRAHIAEQLRGLAVPIAGLHPDPANARRHPERNLEAIKASLSMFGQRHPIIVQKQGMIVRAGNGRLAAAKALGWTEIAAILVDDDNVTATQFAIADNRTAELAEWDNESLGALLQQMDDQDREALAFSREEFEELLGSLEPEEPSGDPSSVLGDLMFSVQVMCDSEEQQAELIERLSTEGYTCKALMS